MMANCRENVSDIMRLVLLNQALDAYNYKSRDVREDPFEHFCEWWWARKPSLRKGSQKRRTQEANSRENKKGVNKKTSDGSRQAGKPQKPMGSTHRSEKTRDSKQIGVGNEESNNFSGSVYWFTFLDSGSSYGG